MDLDTGGKLSGNVARICKPLTADIENKHARRSQLAKSDLIVKAIQRHA